MEECTFYVYLTCFSNIRINTRQEKDKKTRKGQMSETFYRGEAVPRDALEEAAKQKMMV